MLSILLNMPLSPFDLTVLHLYVRLTTGPVPLNRRIPTTGSIAYSIHINGPVFPTTGPTFKRHFTNGPIFMCSVTFPRVNVTKSKVKYKYACTLYEISSLCHTPTYIFRSARVAG